MACSTPCLPPASSSRVKPQTPTSQIAKCLGKPAVCSVLDRLGTWKFDVLALGEHTDKPLSLVMHKLFSELDFCGRLKVNAGALRVWSI